MALDRRRRRHLGAPEGVWNSSSQRVELGRFGWKANQPTVEQQVAGAFVGDIGITSRLSTVQNCPAGQTACAAAPTGGEPELDDAKLDRVTFYSRTLAVPARRDPAEPGAARGAATFASLGCSSCHTPSVRTGASPILALADQDIQPFSDLLLHDMGPELADQRPDFEASGSEWRTPPLWGIGLVSTVNGHTRFLHDGRAQSLEEAVLWHGGEGEAARRRYTDLPAPRAGGARRLPAFAVRRRRVAALVLPLAVAVSMVAGGCSKVERGRPGSLGAAGSTTSAPSGSGRPAVEVMRAVGTTVIGPAYGQLAAAAAAALEAATTACDLERSKAAWRTTRLAYDRTYAAQGFNSMELRRTLTSVDFWPTDPEKIEALIAGTDPVTVEALAALGARVRGLPAIEVELFGAGAFSGRRCQLAASASTLVRQAADGAAQEWLARGPTLEGGTTVVGSLVSSVVATVGLVEGVQLGIPAGLRQGLPANPRNVRGRMAIEDAAATLAGAQAAIDAGVVPLVSADLGRRLQEAGRAAAAAVAAVPGPLEATILTSVPAIQAAQEVIKVLEVLLSTEVVGSLGLTLSFPSDGD
ncbi:MAG: di-heme oxidoredictase family protein [Acidimicrobiales bacterium]